MTRVIEYSLLTFGLFASGLLDSLTLGLLVVSVLSTY